MDLLNKYCFYVCPHVFTIEVVYIEFYIEDDECYIEKSGGYLKKENCFVSLVFAKEFARILLDKFYQKKLKEIRGVNND